MSWETSFKDVWHAVSGNLKENISETDIAHVVDLTNLDEKATPSDIQQLVARAETHQVAALCVLPTHLPYIDATCTITRATVVNFPTGSQKKEQIFKTIEQAFFDGAKEIDYVFPYQAYLAGDETAALTHCHDTYQHCKAEGLTVKVILETGAFPSMDLIYKLSKDVLKDGCDFLKTSTGKIAIGATLPAVFAILSAIVDTAIPCGIKCSGGIRTREQAQDYMHLAEHMLHKKPEQSWFRLGASGLIDHP